MRMSKIQLAIAVGCAGAGMLLLPRGAALGLNPPALNSGARAPAEGTAAPPFSLLGLDARNWTLAQTRGRVTVLNFFATWCPPCRAETPDLNAIERRYAAKGVAFVGIDDEESPALVSVFAKTKGVRYQIVMDSKSAVEHAYDVRAIPTTYVLDRRGIVRYRQVDELNAKTLTAVLEAVIAGKPIPQSQATRRFHGIVSTALRSLNEGLKSAKAAAPGKTPALDAAINTGTRANKSIDTLLSGPDSSSVSYFDVTKARGALNNALAEAYALRASGSDALEAALLRGQTYEDQERFADAAAQYEQAMQMAPKDTRGYDGAYLAQYEMHAYSRSLEIAQAEAGIAPQEPESWLTVASARNSLHQYGLALEAQRKALALASQAYARKPSAKDAAYELGRVWLKMARTEILAHDAASARPLLRQASAAAPQTIVDQQAAEQLAALRPSQIAIDGSGERGARGRSMNPAHVFVNVRNPSAQARAVNLAATGLPSRWLLSFCYGTVCNPYKVSFALPARGSKRVELLVAPLRETGGPWSMSLSVSGGSTARVNLDAKTAKAAILITAS
ncbi:MAG: redoxin domain-containing protein [Candidatus Eremiobacteraeota bacterium]|nr:redoxin domain-containing protein [Candidatus Eremiobacteraeota bacterium]